MKIRPSITGLVVLCVAASVLFCASAAFAKDGVIVREPELLVVKQGSVTSISLPGPAYEDYSADDRSASFRIVGQALPAGEKSLRGNVNRVSWKPEGDDTLVELSFSSKPQNAIISAIPESQMRPGVEQVIAAFSFPVASKSAAGPAMGGRSPRNKDDGGSDRFGDYEMPELKDYRYSDALVTLNVRNADFREVLWLLSDIGGVSIVLDPYWADEPTGTRRPPGAGVDPGAGGDGGGSQPGFRPGGEFNPNVPSEGAGNLSFNFENVPFDKALELVVMAAGLVMVEVY